MDDKDKRISELEVENLRLARNIRRLRIDNELAGGINSQLNNLRDHYEDVLTKEREKAQAADHAKSAFLANMSHEIRTPMNAIMGMCDFILRDSEDENAKENAIQIQKASESLLTIINDILDFSKIEAGKMEIIESTFFPANLLNDVIHLIGFRITEKPVKLVADISPELPRRLKGDEIRIKQVIINILNNAVKFTEKGTITLKVWPEILDYGQRVIVHTSITDTGIGIKEEDLEKIFSSFSQVDTKKNRAIEGTGLGLAISQRLCNLMGGDIKVESKYGEGSTFSFTTLHEVVDPRPIGEFNENKSIEDREKFSADFIAPEAKILVVDDSRVNLKVASGLLKPYQVQVTSTVSGQEAIELMKKDKYNIVFVDHLMPDMDGIETASIIRNTEELKKSILIALTANAISGSREMYESCGFNDYLSKPINIIELDKLLKKHLPAGLRIAKKQGGDK